VESVAVAWLVAVLVVLVAPVSGTGEPKGTLSTTNCTEPVGCAVEPAELSVTVAVKVTDCPETDGLDDESTPVDVLAEFTVCDTPAEVLALKFPSLL
jgi:hypothetical protein